jgi:hypothetical protein
VEVRGVEVRGGGEIAALQAPGELAQGLHGAAAGLEEAAAVLVHLPQRHPDGADQNQGSQSETEEGGLSAQPVEFREKVHQVSNVEDDLSRLTVKRVGRGGPKKVQEGPAP